MSKSLVWFSFVLGTTKLRSNLSSPW